MSKKFTYSVLILWYLLSANTTFAFNHADSLRGSNGRGRIWWDVQKYDLSVIFDTTTHEITGTNHILLKVTGQPADSMQIDLQDSMKIIKASSPGRFIEVEREGNVWWLKARFSEWKVDSTYEVAIVYAGKPRIAKRPPWDGGFSWGHDSVGNPWIAVSCQGLGASVWWPCKDAQWDEPDSGMTMNFSMSYQYLSGYSKKNDKLKIVSNGRLEEEVPATPQPVKKNKKEEEEEEEEGNDEDIFWTWHVANPINNYDVTFYIGDYVHWHDTLMGEKGKLDLDFWVLRYNEAKARKQFAVVKQMLRCFEYWLGPYPFYEDGYKLVDAPYLGMEHQGAVAYGNDYKMGYLGMDRSMSGYGLNWDYIIIHESGHEWFGNNITARDQADNWIHEGFTSYTEALFTECSMGTEKAKKYSRGLWRLITNRAPVIGTYGVNSEGEDIYEKGAAVLHMIRELVNDDNRFREMLRGLSKEFYHQQVTTEQVENYIAKQTGLDLKAFFDQYLRTAALPELEYYIKDDQLHYKFNTPVTGFTLPVKVTAGDASMTIDPTTEWQQKKWTGGFNVKFSNNFLFKTKS